MWKSRLWQDRTFFEFTKFNATDRYLLFKFTGGKLPHPVYGWAQLSISLPGNHTGPNVTLVSWAYETSGRAASRWGPREEAGRIGRYQRDPTVRTRLHRTVRISSRIGGRESLALGRARLRFPTRQSSRRGERAQSTCGTEDAVRLLEDFAGVAANSVVDYEPGESMTSKVKKSNLRRLASLSALGAGALGLAGKADAGTPDANGVVFSGIVDEKVGFGASSGARATILGPNGAAGVFFKSSYKFQVFTSRTTFQSVIAGSASPQPHGTTFRILNTAPFKTTHFPVNPQGRVWALPRGAKFGSRTVRHVQKDGLVAMSAQTFLGVGTHAVTNFNSTDRYLLFRFSGGELKHPVYGWARLSVRFAGHLGGPNVTLIAYAYDIKGAQIPAGYRGKALDGDEGAYERSGVSALVLGAAGLRSWRAARQAQAPGVAGTTPVH